MALSKTVLKDLILYELELQGINTTGPYSRAETIAIAVGNAVVEHITSSGVPIVDGQAGVIT